MGFTQSPVIFTSFAGLKLSFCAAMPSFNAVLRVAKILC